MRCSPSKKKPRASLPSSAMSKRNGISAFPTATNASHRPTGEFRANEGSGTPSGRSRNIPPKILATPIVLWLFLTAPSNLPFENTDISLSTDGWTPISGKAHRFATDFFQNGKSRIYFAKKRQQQHKERQHEELCGRMCDATTETAGFGLTSSVFNCGPDN